MLPTVAEFDTYTNNKFATDSDSVKRFWISAASELRRQNKRLTCYLAAHMLDVSKLGNDANNSPKREELAEVKLEYFEAAERPNDHFFLQTIWGRLYLQGYYAEGKLRNRVVIG